MRGHILPPSEMKSLYGSITRSAVSCLPYVTSAMVYLPTEAGTRRCPVHLTRVMPGACAGATRGASAPAASATAADMTGIALIWSLLLSVGPAPVDQRAGRSDLNAARSSALKSSGCSHAAK